jgi:hypothetical protein
MRSAIRVPCWMRAIWAEVRVGQPAVTEDEGWAGAALEALERAAANLDRASLAKQA